MGHKINPNVARAVHHSVWYADKPHQFRGLLMQDYAIRDTISKRYVDANISKVDIHRSSQNSVSVKIYCSRPARLIGKKGAERDSLALELTQKTQMRCHVSIVEQEKPETCAQLLAEGISSQLERRVMFRKAMKRAVQTAMRAGAHGIKVRVSGRLGGAEIARDEWYKEGRVPLHTFRADIDYANTTALTTYGIIGVKVWVFRNSRTNDDKKKS